MAAIVALDAACCYELAQRPKVVSYGSCPHQNAFCQPQEAGNRAGKETVVNLKVPVCPLPIAGSLSALIVASNFASSFSFELVFSSFWLSHKCVSFCFFSTLVEQSQETKSSSLSTSALIISQISIGTVLKAAAAF